MAALSSLLLSMATLGSFPWEMSHGLAGVVPTRLFTLDLGPVFAPCSADIVPEKHIASPSPIRSDLESEGFYRYSNGACLEFTGVGIG